MLSALQCLDKRSYLHAVTGPVPLVTSVKRACAVHNTRIGLAGTPYFHALEYTISL